MTARSSRLLLLAFFLTNIIFLSVFADKDGYEGDDLNSIVPMFHLEEAKRGGLLIYRYAWQPLSYEVGALVFRVTGKPSAIFLLAPLAGAISLVLLLSVVWRDRSSISEFVKSLVAMLAIPELWFSGLYFNSTILGLPFALSSFAVLLSKPGMQSSILAGLLLGTASLMRFEFVLAGAALTLIAWNRNRSLFALFSFATGVLAMVGAAVLLGLVDPLQVMEIYGSSAREIAAKANVAGWDLRTKLGVLSVVLSPVGWVIILIGSPIVVFREFRRDMLTASLWVLALMPLCLPLPNLLSVKYAIPLLVFLPSFLVLCLSSIEEQLPHASRPIPLLLASAASLVLTVVSASFAGRAPFISIGTLASRQIGTHDGPRSYGGYVWQIAALDRLAVPTEHQLMAQEVAREFLLKSGPDIVVVGEENFFDLGGAGWRDLQLVLEQSGLRGMLTASDKIEFDYGARKLTLLRELPPDFANRFGVGVKLYDWRER